MIIRILNITAYRTDAPEMFGAFHILTALAAAAAAAAGAFAARKLTDAGRCRLLFFAGVFLLVTEIYKQLFLYYIVNDQIFDWWFFPFQLCSVPMYLCLLLPFTRPEGILRKAFYTFLAGYAFVGAAASLIWPEDFLRPYLSLTLHGFVWHGILLFISLLAAFSDMTDYSAKGQARAAGLFTALSCIAVIINVIAEPRMAAAYSAGGIEHNYAAMFYLNPYHYSSQPIVSTVQSHAGIAAGLILYMLAVIAAAWICSSLICRLSHSGQNK